MKNYLAHTGEILITAVLGAALRIAALYPAAAALFASDVGVVWIIAGALAYLFLILPSRVMCCARLRLFAGGALRGRLTYARCLDDALRRLGRALVWGLPALLLSAFWIYWRKVGNGKSLYYILKDVGAFFGGRVDLGYAVMLAALLVAYIVFAVGWWLDMEADFRDATVGDSKAERKRRRRARKRIFGKRLSSCGINILFTLPSLALWGLILFRLYFGDIHFEYGLMAAGHDFSVALLKGIPGTAVLRMALVLLTVHLPLAIVRKIRNAEMIVKAAEGEDRTEA